MLELRQMGLPRVWIDAVDLLGAGRLIELWRHLDRNADVEHEGRLRMTMPAFSRYRRFQRNRYIQALEAEGCSPDEIQERVARELGERISIRHIKRLRRG